MFSFDKISEQRIQDAIANGELDVPELKGKPLVFQDLSLVPEDLRMGFKVLKNSGLLPEEMQLRKDIANMQEMIASNGFSEEGSLSAKEKLKNKLLRYKMILERRK